METLPKSIKWGYDISPECHQALLDNGYTLQHLPIGSFYCQPDSTMLPLTPERKAENLRLEREQKARREGLFAAFADARNCVSLRSLDVLNSIHNEYGMDSLESSVSHFATEFHVEYETVKFVFGQANIRFDGSKIPPSCDRIYRSHESWAKSEGERIRKEMAERQALEKIAPNEAEKTMLREGKYYDAVRSFCKRNPDKSEYDARQVMDIAQKMMKLGKAI